MPPLPTAPAGLTGMNSPNGLAPAYADSGPVPRETAAELPIEVFVQPGELFVGDQNFRPRTLLGSCVSITLWDARTRRGGLSHFLLPSRGAAPAARLTDSALDGRYGDEALELMLRQLQQQGVSHHRLEAKIFGGGDMFPGQATDSRMQVGRRNGLAARALLDQAGIAVVSASLFGVGHRQVIFDLSSGDVWVHQVAPAGPGRRVRPRSTES